MDEKYIPLSAALKAFEDVEDLYSPEQGNTRYSPTDVKEILNGVEPADVRPVVRISVEERLPEIAQIWQTGRPTMADLLIRGMALPQSNDEKILIYHDGTAIKCDLSFGRRTLVAGRGEAVELPDHGPLGDLDVLYNAVEQRYKLSSGIEHRCERDLLDLICNSDTIIPASKEGAE